MYNFNWDITLMSAYPNFGAQYKCFLERYSRIDDPKVSLLAVASSIYDAEDFVGNYC